MTKELTINISENNRRLKISAPVKDSLHASRLSDRINNLPYLKVFERSYNSEIAIIECHTIRGIYSIEKLHADLDTMSDLIILPNEEPQA